MSFFLPTEEQVAISRGLAEFLADQFPIDRSRTSHVYDKERWSGLVQMGILGISIPESEGGLGLSLMDEVLVSYELGRNLVSPAVIGSMLAPQVAVRTGARALLDTLLAGERRVGIAAPHSPSEIRVVDGDSGLFLLVGPQGMQLLDCGSDRLRVLLCIDETVHLSATSIPEAPLASVEDRTLVLVAHLLSAAMLCGQLETTCDMAAGYARSRVQFGRPIGAFQAIKHRCADIALAAELCWSQTLHAAEALTSAAEDAEFHVFSAKLLAGDEALKAARFNIQAHGGMGFTSEVDAQLLMKRAHVLQQLFGDPRRLHSKLVDLTLVI